MLQKNGLFKEKQLKHVLRTYINTTKMVYLMLHKKMVYLRKNN